MKTIFLLFTFFFFASSCGEEKQPEPQENSIYGTWQLVEQWLGNVGDTSVNWTQIQNGYTFSIEPNNRFSSTKFQECTQGIIDINETQIVFKYECSGFTVGIESPEGEFSYKYSFVENKLNLKPNFLDCDEGCGYRFSKIVEN